VEKYRIKYRDWDPTSPVFSEVVTAYNREHAEEVFWEMDDDDDWKIISIKKVG
jgi:hypothetical protein